MHQIRAVSLSRYPEIADELGLDGNRLLNEAGIKRADLADSEARLPAGATTALLEKSARLAGCDSFGLRLARGRSFASLGPLTLYLQHLANVAEVIQAAIAFRRYLSDVIFVSLEQGPDVSLVSFDLVPPFRKPQASDLAMAIGFLLLQGASQGRWHPEAVHFTHEAPRDRAEFEAFFQAPLEFSSSFNGVSCATSSLDIPLPLADEAMAANARRLLRIMRVRTEHSAASDHAKQAILLLLGSGRATLENVAAQLGRTPRSLQRSLEAEGYGFGSLLNEVRRELAEQYLHGQEPITAISDKLGYATPSSFTRWFHGEFGHSPRAWRDALRAPATGPPPLWRV